MSAICTHFLPPGRKSEWNVTQYSVMGRKLIKMQCIKTLNGLSTYYTFIAFLHRLFDTGLCFHDVIQANAREQVLMNCSPGVQIKKRGFLTILPWLSGWALKLLYLKIHRILAGFLRQSLHYFVNEPKTFMTC